MSITCFYVVYLILRSSVWIKDATTAASVQVLLLLKYEMISPFAILSTRRQCGPCVRVCACVGGDTGESVNQSSALTERLRQQLTSESAAAIAATGPPSPSREDSNVHTPSYGRAPPP